jgi:5-hydroxyisourate hydrolase-like protein (transthyretin family)
MPRRRLAAIAYLLALLLPALTMKAQQPAPDQIGGRVVSEIDGRPIMHATITLTNLKNEQTAATTTADDDGRFRFGPIAPGKYRMTGSATHYLTAAYLDHGGFSTAIVTGAGLATNSLLLPLAPVSAISGHILDDTGEPVQHAMVTLYRENLTGSKHIARFRNAQTEDDGEYEFTGLPRGRYFLSASGTPWYAVHPPLDRADANATYRAMVDPALDVAYPTMFYPDALDSDGATPLIIRGGDQLTADLQMHAQHAVSLILRFAPGEKLNERMPQLTQSIFGTEEPINAQMEFIDGTQKINGIVPGQYNVQASTGNSNAFPAHTASIDLTAASTSLDLPKSTDLATLTVTMHAANGASLPEQMQTNLRSINTNRTVGSRVNNKGTAEFANVPPGDYRLILLGSGHLMNVLAVTMNGQRVADKQLRITASGAIPIDVTFSPVAIQVEGFARRDDKPVAGSMVALVPAGADTDEQLFRRDQSDLDGSFTFSNVAPGNYILIAIDDGWPLHWTDIPTLAPYLLHGVPVSIPTTGSSTIHLTESVTPQPR